MKKFLLALSLLLIPTVAFAGDTDKTFGQAANKVTDFAIQKINSLIDIAAKTLPTATKYAMQVVSMGCLVEILYWLIFVVIACVSVRLFFVYLKKAWDEGEHGETFAPYVIVSIITGVASLISTIATLAGLNIWNFICVIHPDIYLIHLAVQKVLGG